MEKYLGVNLLRLGPRFDKKKYRAAVSRFRTTVVKNTLALKRYNFICNVQPAYHTNIKLHLYMDNFVGRVNFDEDQWTNNL
jgi:hypothetical protein